MMIAEISTGIHNYEYKNYSRMVQMVTDVRWMMNGSFF